MRDNGFLPEMDELLVERFPVLYRDRHKSMQETCMYWGFECGAGWSRLVWETSETLEGLSRATGYSVIAEQVKSKWAALEMYVHVEDGEGNEAGTLNVDFMGAGRWSIPTGDGESEELRAVRDAARAVVGQARAMSLRTCEACGSRRTARPRPGGWVMTLCDACETERTGEAPEPEVDPGHVASVLARQLVAAGLFKTEHRAMATARRAAYREAMGEEAELPCDEGCLCPEALTCPSCGKCYPKAWEEGGTCDDPWHDAHGTMGAGS